MIQLSGETALDREKILSGEKTHAYSDRPTDRPHVIRVSDLQCWDRLIFPHANILRSADRPIREDRPLDRRSFQECFTSRIFDDHRVDLVSPLRPLHDHHRTVFFS